MGEPGLRVVSEELHLDTEGEGDVVDITPDLSGLLDATGLKNGLLTVFVSGSTAAVTTIEFEPGLKEDLKKALNRMVPDDIPYAHDKTWSDGNGHSHIRASLIGPSLTIPFKDRHLTLGTWQQVVLVEMDIRSRSRQLIIQIIGE
ncbi:MAG: secondary thiamine-phosphate synthase enzyme [Thaumarchaeota archaeon RBG_16_49_8]|nr:MAG: secondary thiamine-phosphate synthase enzyme [Thaumarchaeota archaeon RBG_16_49_8]